MRGFYKGIIFFSVFFSISAFAVKADIIFVPPSATLAAQHAGVYIDNGQFFLPTTIDGAQLSGVNDAWDIGFLESWSDTPVPLERGVVGIFKGSYFSPAYPLVAGENLSFTHIPLSDQIGTTTVSIPVPVLGRQSTPSGTYTIFVSELPETKQVCEDVEPYDCVEEPYTDQDLINYLTTDPSQPDAPLTHSPLQENFIVFNYISGQAPEGCSEDCYSSIIFLPGIKASVLKSGSDTLWPPTSWSNDVPQLALDGNGDSVNNVRVNGILNSFYGTAIYQTFSDFMDDLVAEGVINEWLPFAYDWRYAPERIITDGVVTDGGIKNPIMEIKRLAEDSKSGKVTIVAHSMGGLLGKAIIKALEADGDDDLIEAFVMVGTPQLGTPQAVASLLHGDGEGIAGNFIVKAKDARALSKNLPSAHNLLPSPAYFESVLDPVIKFDSKSNFTRTWRDFWGDFINVYDDFAEFLTGQGVARTVPEYSNLKVPEVLRTELVDGAAAFHDEYDNYQFPFHIRVVQIAGWGRPTVKAVEYKNKHFSQNYGVVFTREGDGTVVYPSAISSENEEAYFFNVFDYNDFFDEDAQHRDLLNTISIKNFIASVLRNEDVSTTTLINIDKPAINELGEQLLVSSNSPVILGAYDASGNFTGINQNQNLSADILATSENIPGSAFIYTNESQYIFVPKDGDYRFVYRGTGDGPTTVAIEDFHNDSASPIAQFSDIPTTETTGAEFTISGSAPEDTVISIDADGDGDADFSVSADGGESLSELIALLKERISSLDIKDKLKKELLKKVSALEKKIEKNKRDNAKTLTKLKEKISKKDVKKKIENGDANELLSLIELLEAQSDDISLDADVLAKLKEKITSLDVKKGVKDNLLKRVRKLENKNALIHILAKITKDLERKAKKDKMSDADTRAIIDLLDKIESVL